MQKTRVNYVDEQENDDDNEDHRSINEEENTSFIEVFYIIIHIQFNESIALDPQQ